MVTLVIAQLVFFIALLGPAIIGIGLKVQSIVPDADKADALGIVAGFGALVAAVANIVFGRLSDLTHSRWGRRRPWIVGGSIGMAIALALLAIAPDIPQVTAAWCLAQLAANAAFAPFIATISDQVPTEQRGSVSALLGIAQSIGILGGTWVAELFADQMLVMFALPAAFAIGAMLLFASVLDDRPLPPATHGMTKTDWLATFWVNPRRHPDFALAWLSRFLIMLSIFMFTTFRLFYVQDRLDVPLDDAPRIITRSVLVYTIASIICAFIAGRISDKTGRRKFLVGGSTVLFAVCTALLVHIETVMQFYVLEVFIGAAIGTYMAVDLALIVDVLPRPEDAGKDLGILNIANSLPQTIAPAVGAVLLGLGSAASQNYVLLLYAAGLAGLLGGLAIVPIRKVR